MYQTLLFHTDSFEFVVSLTTFQVSDIAIYLAKKKKSDIGIRVYVYTTTVRSMQTPMTFKLHL